MTYENTLPIEVRKKLGVWYTPTEIVEYMVKGIENLLNSKFNLPLDSQDIQILDPATGTGTFIDCLVNKVSLAEIHGIEIDPDAYEIASEKFKDLDNVKVYNLNTLEGALKLKSSKVRVVLGNPPYNGNSKNNGDFITELMNSYKVSNKNIGKGLNDDYIKFIRYGQSLIDQNQSGILAYISNNSFIQSLACSKMRDSLLNSFDEIYILNLHGDKDENVFSITTPVCISFFVKTNKKVAGKVFYHEIKGLKSDKISYCLNSTLNLDFKEIEIIGSEKYFIPQDVDAIKDYNKNSFSLDDLFLTKGQAILTACDDLVIDTNKTNLLNKINDFQTKGWLPEKIENGADSEHTGKIKLRSLKNKDGEVKPFAYRPFDNRFIYDSDMVHRRKTELTQHDQVQGNIYLNNARTGKIKLRSLKNKDGEVKPFPYRPFDTRFIYDSDMVLYRKETLTEHDQVIGNIYINFKHNCWDKNDFTHICISKNTPSNEFFAHGATYTAPLYLHSPYHLNPTAPQFTSNLNHIIKSKFTSLDPSITDLDIIDYIYGVLNDKNYTTKYNQFLKSNYPRVPYPKDTIEFNVYKDKGTTLRLVHLDDKTEDEQSTFNATTNNKIEKVSFDADKVYFNKTSYFDQITQEMWDFKIGASQPLKNWLESRKEDTFDQAMIEQYLNVIYKVRHSI
jgi:predicted helicase